MNEGAFRGIVLVGIAVVIGLILLGSGLDDTVSTARSDDSSSSSDEDSGSSDDGEGDEAVQSPLEPSQINVIVANGAGVDGAAATISARLTDLGYVPLPPTDTTVESTETPLDAVYYATSPNTEAHAQKVAADLGLAQSAVLPYPGRDVAPADMGLAQVLVVLGSAEGQLATAAAGTTETVPG